MKGILPPMILNFTLQRNISQDWAPLIYLLKPFFFINWERIVCRTIQKFKWKGRKVSMRKKSCFGGVRRVNILASKKVISRDNNNNVFSTLELALIGIQELGLSRKIEVSSSKSVSFRKENQLSKLGFQILVNSSDQFSFKVSSFCFRQNAYFESSLKLKIKKGPYSTKKLVVVYCKVGVSCIRISTLKGSFLGTWLLKKLKLLRKHHFSSFLIYLRKMA